MAEAPRDAPVLLLDGMSLAFRAFFALPPDIQTSGGTITNALHGFASMLVTLIESREPSAVVVAFDLPGGTFRDALTEDYKGGRAETPPEIEHQFDLIRGLCDVLHIPVVGVPTYEADDVLATIATWGRDAHRPVVVVSGDRDTFQLVEDPYVRVLYNRRGVSDYSLYDEAGIIERCGVEPRRYPLLAALRGDSSDNLPGVPGIGEKTAAKLLGEYRDFDELFAHLDRLTPKLRANLAEYEERARNNARVMMLVRDVPLPLALDDLRLGGWSGEEVHAFFDRYEMSTARRRFDALLRRGLLGPGSAPTAAPADEAPVAVEVHARRPSTWAEVLVADELVVATAPPRIALYDAATGRTALGDITEVGSDLLARRLVGHDLKELLRALVTAGAEVSPPVDDTAIMGYLLDSSSGHYTLADLAERFLHEAREAAPTLLGTVDDDRLGEDAVLVARLRGPMRAATHEWGLDDVYGQIELPLEAVLARMEARGVHVDRALLQRIADEFAAEAASLDARIQEVAGHPFKVNSTGQLQTVLFEELGLTPSKKTKTGYSTDAQSLENIVDEHEIVPLILRYREVEKLRSTYGESLLATVGPDDRIHATFSQTVARTGRLASENPNLHNIPVRSPDGRRLRFAFTAEPGWRLAVADYNQIELRILAHLSQDAGLLHAFAAHEDIHRSIASLVFGIASAEVTPEQRERAKAVSYGLVYGMEAYGLSQRLGVSVAAAKQIMDQYFAAFPSLRHYLDQTVAEVRAKGYSRTEFGRIRPFPDLATAVGPQRAAVERQAMNAGIQGLAADVFKSALVRLDEGLRAAGLRARLVLQVHDEVIVESPADEEAAVTDVIVDALTHAAALSVPLEISLHWGDNWADAKG